MNEKTKGNVTLNGHSGHGWTLTQAGLVDENLFYKGVDKSVVHGARLHQTHSSEGAPGEAAQAPDPTQPPYPFSVRHAWCFVETVARSDCVWAVLAAQSGDSLLALARKHNVRDGVASYLIPRSTSRAHVSIVMETDLFPPARGLDDHRPDGLRQRNPFRILARGSA